MKKIKLPIALGAALLAGITSLTSAFTTHNGTAYTFFRTTSVGGNQSTLKSDYQYKTSVLATCNAQLNSFCSKVFTQLTVPSLNDHPTTTANLVSTRTGVYNFAQ